MKVNIDKFLKSLTTRPGVYCMKNKESKIIYVGKAKNLKKRVSSYFNRNTSISIKTDSMIKQIDDIDITVTQTENEACLLYTSPSPRDATLSRMPSSA